MTVFRTVLAAFLILAFNFLFARQILAFDVPSFPTCAAPIGTQKEYFANGTHGIPGDTTTHVGSDSVIAYTDNQLIQCFCAADGNGIQTNWWKIPELDQEQIKSYLNDNWNYIPDGSAWGLENAPYLAKNYAMICAGGRGGGEVLGANLGTGGGEVLGLAATGNITQIYGCLAFGLFLIYCAFRLRE